MQTPTRDAGKTVPAKDGGAGADAGDAAVVDATCQPLDAALPDSGVCSYDPSAGPTCGCSDDRPSACPDPAPSYKDSVAQAIANNCQPCHRIGGLAPDKPFDTYKNVTKLAGTILSRVSGCQMPPACARQPTPDERQVILGWLVCGAPDN